MPTTATADVPTFADLAGRTWKVELDVPTIAKVQNLMGINLALAFNLEAGTLTKLTSDPLLVIDLLWIVCKDQVKAAGISLEEFGRGFNGDVILLAWHAVTEAAVKFLPTSRQPAAREFLQAALEIGGEIEKAAAGYIAELSADVDRMVAARKEREAASLKGGA